MSFENGQQLNTNDKHNQDSAGKINLNSKEAEWKTSNNSQCGSNLVNSNSNLTSTSSKEENKFCSNSEVENEQLFTDTVKRQVLKSDGVYVEGQVQVSEVNFTLDNGAVRTVLSVNAFNKIPQCKRPNLVKSILYFVRMASPLKI